MTLIVFVLLLIAAVFVGHKIGGSKWYQRFYGSD